MKLLVVFLSVVAAVVVHGQDECMTNRGMNHIHAGECCNMDRPVIESYLIRSNACMNKFPRPPRPSGPPPSGERPTPSPEMKNSYACMSECVFSENKLLTSDNKLDKDAIINSLTMRQDGAMKAVITAAVTKCIDQIEVDTSAECKSGAHEFRRCLIREIFLNCPSSAWIPTSDCEGLKKKVTNCPKFTVNLGPRRGPPRPYTS